MPASELAVCAHTDARVSARAVRRVQAALDLPRADTAQATRCGQPTRADTGKRIMSGLVLQARRLAAVAAKALKAHAALRAVVLRRVWMDGPPALAA